MIRVLQKRDAAVLRLVLPLFEKIKNPRSPDEAGAFSVPVSQNLRASAGISVLDPELVAVYATDERAGHRPQLSLNGFGVIPHANATGDVPEIDAAINLTLLGWRCAPPATRPGDISTGRVTVVVSLDFETIYELPDSWFHGIELKDCVVHDSGIVLRYRTSYLGLRNDKFVFPILSKAVSQRVSQTTQ